MESKDNLSVGKMVVGIILIVSGLCIGFFLVAVILEQFRNHDILWTLWVVPILIFIKLFKRQLTWLLEQIGKIPTAIRFLWTAFNWIRLAVFGLTAKKRSWFYFLTIVLLADLSAMVWFGSSWVSQISLEESIGVSMTDPANDSVVPSSSPGEEEYSWNGLWFILSLLFGPAIFAGLAQRAARQKDEEAEKKKSGGAESKDAKKEGEKDEKK